MIEPTNHEYQQLLRDYNLLVEDNKKLQHTADRQLCVVEQIIELLKDAGFFKIMK
jgi:hypothetical protein